jgi:CRP/FNR family cyclic AMP-dependent transcriptional regulator
MAVSSPDLKAFLVATPFFGGLSDASLDLLISMLVEHRFEVGVTVVAEGEPGRSMYIVHSGELVVSKLGESGRAIRMTGLGPGDFFGEMTLIEMQNRSATVVADSPTVLYESHGPKPLHILQGRHLRVCDGDAEYQPRALSAAPPCRQSHCRAGRCFTRVNDAESRASCGLRRNCNQRSRIGLFAWW